MNAALEAADLGFDVGLSGPDQKGLNISDFTIFIPTNEAFEAIGSRFCRSRDPPDSPQVPHHPQQRDFLAVSGKRHCHFFAG